MKGFDQDKKSAFEDFFLIWIFSENLSWFSLEEKLAS